MLLTAAGIHVQYLDKPILDNIQITLQDRDKAALTGINGSGKSTLLKVLAGLENGNADIKRTKNSTIHYLPQTPEFQHKTIRAEMDHWNQTRKNPSQPYEIDAILTKLDLPDQDIQTLSGGQKKRLALAKALTSGADILLLDEPTNHLDTNMIEWLETQLKKTTQIILVVTHDRTFLENVCTTIYELDNATLYTHHGSYDQYLQDIAQRKETETRQQQSLENLYRKELAWVRAGVQARSTKSKSRLDRFETLRQQRHKQQEQTLTLQTPMHRLGKQIGQWENLSGGYDQPLFEHFTYQIKKGDRIGICGPNGCGKTTLLKVLAQKLPPKQGTIQWGTTVKTGWLGQLDIEDNLDTKVLDYIEETAAAIQWNNSTMTSTQMLEHFHIPKDRHHLPLQRLSGGERRRIHLLKVLMQAPNVLFLDEPTNDLDLETLTILEDYLDHFPGIVITVTHDRTFLDRVCETLFVFDHQQIRQVSGSYSDNLHNQQKPPKEKKPDTRKRKPNPLTWQEKKELEQLPQKLETLQQQIDQLNQTISQTTTYEQLAPLCQQRDQLEQQLEQQTERWMTLEEKRET